MSVSLTFKDALSWKAGRPIQISTLIKRLKALSDELMLLDPEKVDKNSLVRVTKELCMPALMQHKDKGVKAFVACCLADILSLHAPDAPFTVLQLRVCGPTVPMFSGREMEGLTCFACRMCSISSLSNSSTSPT